MFHKFVPFSFSNPGPLDYCCVNTSWYLIILGSGMSKALIILNYHSINLKGKTIQLTKPKPS